jgi:acyl-CoA synthetase (AMP-forming)/AMP-acid ligase II
MPLASTTGSPDSLYACVQEWTRRRPDTEAVIDGERRFNYRQLSQNIDACAAAMVAAGIEPGDRVMTLAPPGADFLVTFLATAAVGGIWSGLNPRYAVPELDALVERLEPRLVFWTPEIEGRSYRAWAASLPPTIRSIELGSIASRHAAAATYADFIAAGATCPASRLATRCQACHPDEPSLIVFTSGSTGTPKGAMISQRALLGASRVQAHLWAADPMRVLVNLPINHIGCVGDLCCHALVSGGTMVFTPRFDPAASLDAIERHAITVWGQVPTMFQLTLDAPGFDASRLASLQWLFWGGAHASAELIERLSPLAPRIATSYGQTETVGSVAFTSADASPVTLRETVGRAVPPYEIRIVDANGAALPTAHEGEIEVRTPFGMCGYWRDPDASARVLAADGWQRTGDVGMLDAHGNLKLLGRVHDVFKSGGYNLYPAEIEAALAEHPDVREASVVGVPDLLYGNVAVAFLVVDRPLEENTLRQHLRDRLANYKIPKRFRIIDQLPRLPVGKVDKSALRAHAVAQ